MDDEYRNREQTRAKHFILRRYLQTLAFKWLEGGARELTYVDAFSGPWNSRDTRFADTSFMIAIDVLKDARTRFAERNDHKTVRCCFVEKDPRTFKQLEEAVRVHHDPANGFCVATFRGRFEDVAEDVLRYIGRSFSLTFIDPTGWTGYPYAKIGKVLQHIPGEVLLNFMYDFFSRFVASDDPKIVASFDPILGGVGWKQRLDSGLPPGLAAERLCIDELKHAGGFRYVVATKIDKADVDRPHYSLIYGTRNSGGLGCISAGRIRRAKGP